MDLSEKLVILSQIVALGCGIHALMTKTRGPTSALAWLLVCFALPFLGSLLYLTVGRDHVHRKNVFGIRMAGAVFRAHMLGNQALRTHVEGDGAPEQHEELQSLIPQRRALEDLMGAPFVGGNALELFLDGDQAYPALFKSLEAARQSINLQFFIIDDDAVGQELQRILIKKVQEGVEVRLLHDAVGCHKTSRGFFECMKQAGVKSSAFMPLDPLRRRWRINLRNHRKLAVVDGLVAFTGSLNISVRHLVGRQGTSHDVGLRVRGPIVPYLQRSFARDWFFSTRENLAAHHIFCKPEKAGGVQMAAVESGPDKNRRDLRQLLVSAIHRAEHSVMLITPYFIPDVALTSALVTAATRGLDVTLLIPQRTDNRLINLAVPNFLQPLAQAGVRLLKRPGPMIHMKMTLIDKQLAVIGSSNLDNRSLYLNFELDLVIPRDDVAAPGHAAGAISEFMEREVQASQPASVLRCLYPRFGPRLATRVASLFAPIL